MAAKPKQLTQVTQKALTDAAECGFIHWGPAGITGFAWVTDHRGHFHAIHATTRGGARQSQHACGLLREAIEQKAAKLYGKVLWSFANSDVEAWRSRERLRLQMIVCDPTWQCDVDGAVVVHPAISTAAVEQIHIEVGA
jgi:hypothetical protein